MTLETIAIDDLQAHPRNYRGHPAEQIAHLKASLAEYGIVKNIVVASDNVILAGHGLVQAAREAGYKELPVCRIAMPSTDPKAQKFMVLDNEVQRKAHDDGEQLAALLKELQDSQDLTGTGYDSDEVTQLLNDLQAEEFGATLNEDAGPEEPPIEPVTRLGDIWVMGEHRLVCGDCTEVGAWDAVTRGVKVSAVLSDPPYGVTDAPWDRRVTNDDINIMQAYSTGQIMLFGACDPSSMLSVLTLDTVPERILVWRTNVPNSYNPDQPFWTWQPIYVWRQKGTKLWDSIGWNENQPTRTGEHPYQKPIELMGKLADACEAKIVLDPFMGSGTTLLGCESVGRICYGIELEPRYVDVAVKRWQKLTGKQAILESTGEAFSGE